MKQFLFRPFSLVSKAGWQEMIENEVGFFILGKTQNEDLICCFEFYSKQITIIPKNAFRDFPKASSSSSCAIS